MRLLRGVYEGPASHGILRIAAGMRGIRAVLRAHQDEGYFPALFRGSEMPPVSVRSILPDGEGSRSPGNLGRDLKQLVNRHQDTDTIILAHSESALLSGEEVPEIEPPDNPQTGRNVKLVSCDWESARIGEHEAANLALESLVRAHATSQEKSATSTVNVFGPPALHPGAGAEFEETERLLGLIGVDVNASVPFGTTVEDLSRLPRAWANLLLYRETGEAAAQYLQEEFETPRVTTPMIGAAGTGAVLRSIGELCSIDPEKVQRAIWSELARTAELPWYARLSAPETFRGRRVAIFGDFTHAIGLGYTLSREIGLEVASCGTYLKHLGQDFLFQAGGFTDGAFVSDDPEEVATRIESSDPDILIGTYLEEEVADSLGIPFMQFCPPSARQPLSKRPIMGYEGAATLADAVDEAVRKLKDKPEVREEPGLPWTEEALEELESVPVFLRGRARRLAEDRAREMKSPRITPEILDESRQ